jgi:hypothetical protein
VRTTLTRNTRFPCKQILDVSFMFVLQVESQIALQQKPAK